ncbi:dermonecrotic toxin domain-containing protein [Pseudomonas khavaziana]|uniref:Dermonecrotic toxin N-terminal domain-containing protein n=1 Tax=Pseudomonas khavaziana TaxID=2842351 RepID=A0ABZ2DA51_9PSED
MSTDTTSTWADKLDFDDPHTTSADRDEAMRTLLTRRLNAVMQPSLEINRLHQAQASASEAAKVLSGLLGRAPRVLGVVRNALHEAFGLDPDTVLFTEPRPPAPPQKVDSLTERALALLIQPYVPVNINHFTALSIKDDPARTLPYTAWDALVRVKGLALLGRIEQAAREYWQQLAHGSWLTRRERWVQLRTSLFAANAWLAYRAYHLSDSGYDMLRKLLEIPEADQRQRAGGEWANVQASKIMWPATNQRSVSVPGALHIYREGGEGDSTHVVYLPGLFRQFYEFASWHQLVCDLPILVNGPLSRMLWQCLPLRRWHELCEAPSVIPMPFVPQRGGVLRGDALLVSAGETLDGQWDNELACALSINHAAVGLQGASASAAPDVRRFLKFIEKGRRRLVTFPRLGHTLEILLEWDRQRRSDEIVAGHLAPELALKTREAQLKRYEKGLMGLLDATDVSKDSVAYQDFLSLERQWQTHVETARKWARGPLDRVFEKEYWQEQPEGSRNRGSSLGSAQLQALLYEAQMQHRLSLLSDAHLAHLETALSKAWRPGQRATDTCVLQVAVGGDAFTLYPLLGAVLVTCNAAQANPDAPHPVLLYVAGHYEGLVAFDSLSAFAKALEASLKSRDGSMLWRCIGRHQRTQARMAISAVPTDTPLVVSYAVIERALLKDLFIKQVQHHIEMNKRIDQGHRLFNQVSDRELSRLLLAQELFDGLQVPANDARTLAMANLNLLQTAAIQAKKLPAWLATATSAQRQHYKGLCRRYLASAWAVERKLWLELPDLESFARQALIARLSKDGLYPPLDIDKPLLDVPDDVSSQLCSWSSQCAVADRDVKITVSQQRTTFSLLQLALHNLDPKAPWTRWRLNRARWLDPDLKKRLSVRYLIKTLASLDLGGEYDKLIQRAFYPPASTRIPSQGLSQALVYRALQQRAQMQVYSAVRQGLSEQAQRLFSRVMEAQVASDLRGDGLDVQLGLVRLVGHTLEHDRHVAAMLVMQDRLSGLCVVYWPAALESPPIAEYASVALAEQALNKDGALPLNRKVLARQVAPGWETQAVDSYPGEDPQLAPRKLFVHRIDVPSVARLIGLIVGFFTVRHKVPAVDPDSVAAQINEQIALVPEGWLATVTTSQGNARALLAHARMFEVQRRTQAQSNSSLALQAYREQRLGEQHAASIRGLLSFVPVLGVGISLYEMLLAARRYHFSRDAHDAVDVAFLTLLAFVDVLLSFGPAPKGARVARVALSHLHRHHGFASGALAGLNVSPGRPLSLLGRFKYSGGLEDAVELKWPQDKGRYVKNGQQLLADGDEIYSVYQRRNEADLRLKTPSAQGSDELMLHIEHPREWLLQADAPVAGPSSAVFQPWAPARSAGEWAPPSRALTEAALRASPIADTTWQSWGFQPDFALNEVAPPRRIYQVPAMSGYPGYEVLQLGDNYFRLLPQGSGVSSRSIVFIMRNHDLSFRAYGYMERWLGSNSAEQPVPTTLGTDGLWTPHQPLFNEPLSVTVGRAFPMLTEGSRLFLGERLVELADSGTSITATHLLNIRASLDHWLAPGTSGHMVDLLKILRPAGVPGAASINIGVDGASPGFMRVDFAPPFRLDTALLRSMGRGRNARRSQAAQGAVRQVLEQNGFVVSPIDRRHGGPASIDFFCTHPETDRVYFVLTRWADNRTVVLRSRVAPQLSDTWFRQRFISATPFSAEFAAMKIALNEGRLVRLVAGVQWSARYAEPPSVFFAKVAALTP